MAGIRRIRRGLTRGVLFAFVLGSCIPLLAQERKPNEEKDKENRTTQERSGIDGGKSVRLPLELEQGKAYTFAVTSLGGERSRSSSEREKTGDQSSREGDSEASPQRRSAVVEDQGGAERLMYRFDAKKSAASSGETTVQVTVSQGSTLGLPGASTPQGASPQDRSVRPGSQTGMMTYMVTVGKDGEIRPDAAAGQHAMPEETKQHVALILGHGLHQKMLKAGETYGQEAFSGSKHHESRSSASESSASPKSPVERRESVARDTAKSTNYGKLEGVAFVFRGTVEREGKELAFFDIVKSDGKGRASPSPSSQSSREEGQAAQAKDRSGGALRSGAFQERSENQCGSATYNVKDGLIEQLSLTHSSRAASRSDLRSESGREEEAAGARTRSSKEGESGLTLLIRRIDGSAGIPRTPEKSTGSSDRDESN